ncbi:Isopenicillin N synthase-like, Fe(2+) 2OG dioxygenase domain [Dillenia turbinata]|uniref:Isopenicillin N synthase-like, Fe(2+) 2OG dioxygenase domain n=1 Tax=Dillenia turbinata TaxID=194707 RepID=A0AAN8Z2J9_9MAGN
MEMIGNTSTSPLSFPTHYILPEDKRPHLSQVTPLVSLPVIDLNDVDLEDGQGPSPLVQKVSKACEEYGFFQIINHGVPQELCDSMLNAVANFFELPDEERARFATNDYTKRVRVTKYYLKDEHQQKIPLWSETLVHPWDVIDNKFIFTHMLPENPPQYREVVAQYSKEIGALMTQLLSLISRALGLQKDHLQKNIGEKPTKNAQANYYPPCPEPELTLGLASHTDLCALTILRQTEGIIALQVLKDDNWVSIDPVPNAFVVMSNGRFKSVHHRTVTNKNLRRVSMAMFYAPNPDTVIGPVEDLVDEEHPPIYRSYHYAEFLQEFRGQEGTRRRVTNLFEL